MIGKFATLAALALLVSAAPAVTAESALDLLAGDCDPAQPVQLDCTDTCDDGDLNCPVCYEGCPQFGCQVYALQTCAVRDGQLESYQNTVVWIATHPTEAAMNVIQNLIGGNSDN